MLAQFAELIVMLRKRRRGNHKFPLICSRLLVKYISVDSVISPGRQVAASQQIKEWSDDSSLIQFCNSKMQLKVIALFSQL